MVRERGERRRGKAVALGRDQLLVNYISSNDDECFSTGDAFAWKSLARTSVAFGYSIRL